MQILSWHLEMMTPCNDTVRGWGWGAALQCSPEVTVGNQLNTTEVSSDSKGSFWTVTRGMAQRSRKGIVPLCVALHTTSKYWVQLWNPAEERRAQTGGSSREGSQGGRAGALALWGETGEAGLGQLGKETALGYSAALSTTKGSWKRWSGTSHSDVGWEGKKQSPEVGMREVQGEYREKLFHEEATQLTLSGCAASIPGGFQGLTGPSPKQPAWSQSSFGQEDRLGLSQSHLTYNFLILTNWKWGTALNTLNEWECCQADSSCTEPDITHCRCDGQHPTSKWQATLFFPFCFLKALEVCASPPDRNLTTQIHL